MTYDEEFEIRMRKVLGLGRDDDMEIVIDVAAYSDDRMVGRTFRGVSDFLDAMENVEL